MQNARTITISEPAQGKHDGAQRNPAAKRRPTVFSMIAKGLLAAMTDEQPMRDLVGYFMSPKHWWRCRKIRRGKKDRSHIVPVYDSRQELRRMFTSSQQSSLRWVAWTDGRIVGTAASVDDSQSRGYDLHPPRHLRFMGGGSSIPGPCHERSTSGHVPVTLLVASQGDSYETPPMIFCPRSLTPRMVSRGRACL